MRMLKKCAPGAEVVLKKHRHWVQWGDRTYRGLPKGAPGSKDPEIERGHVKHMARYFDLDLDCVRKYLPQVA